MSAPRTGVSVPKFPPALPEPTQALAHRGQRNCSVGGKLMKQKEKKIMKTSTQRETRFSLGSRVVGGVSVTFL